MLLLASVDQGLVSALVYLAPDTMWGLRFAGAVCRVLVLMCRHRLLVWLWLWGHRDRLWALPLLQDRLLVMVWQLPLGQRGQSLQRVWQWVHLGQG